MDTDEHGRIVAGPQEHADRICKLTPQRHERIVELVAAANYIGTAAKAAGVSPRTARRWLERGQEHDEKQIDSRYRRLYLAVRQAAAESEARLVGTLELAATAGFETTRKHETVKRDPDGNVTEVAEHTETTQVPRDWRSAAKLLEARWRSRFAPHRQISGRFEHRHAVMSPEDEKVAATIAERRLGRVEARYGRELVDAAQGDPEAEVRLLLLGGRLLADERQQQETVEVEQVHDGEQVDSGE